MDYLQEYYGGKLTEEDLDDMFDEPHATNWKSVKRTPQHSQERMCYILMKTYGDYDSYNVEIGDEIEAEIAVNGTHVYYTGAVTGIITNRIGLPVCYKTVYRRYDDDENFIGYAVDFVTPDQIHMVEQSGVGPKWLENYGYEETTKDDDKHWVYENKFLKDKAVLW